MRPYRVTVGAAGPSVVLPMDIYQGPFNVGIGVSLSPGAALTYTVEHTFDDVYATTFNPTTATWFPNAGLTNRTASMDGNYSFPIMALRINVTAFTSGTATINVLQAGVMG